MAQQIITNIDRGFSITPPRNDFQETNFDNLVYQKGRNVVFSKAIQCPCRGVGTNQQSNCKNCGGVGWTYVNPITTRMIVQGIGAATNYSPYFEQEIGTINISCSSFEKMTQNDRIQFTDAVSIFNEVITAKQKQSTLFAYTKYNIKSVDYLGMFIGSNQAFVRLNQDVDFTIVNNVLMLGPDVKPDAQLTIRYTYYPEYVITEMKRESMESFRYNGVSETIEQMPLSGIGRKLHLVTWFENLNNDRLIDNSYLEIPNF